MSSKSDEPSDLDPRQLEQLIGGGDLKKPSYMGEQTLLEPTPDSGTKLSDFWSWFPALVAEYIGTMLFVAVGCGSVSLGGVGAAFGHGIAIAVMVCCFANVSGGHFNPAVTLAVTLASELEWFMLPLYWIAQVLGGMTGGAVTRGFMSEMSYANISGGAHSLAPGVSVGGAFLCEIAITWVLVQSVLMTAVDPRSRNALAPLIIGFSVVIGILAGVNVTGGSMNPARSIGAAIPASGVLDKDQTHDIWKDHYVYWLAPCIGSVLALLFYRLIFAAPDKRVVGKKE